MAYRADERKNGNCKIIFKRENRSPVHVHIVNDPMTFHLNVDWMKCKRLALDFSPSPASFLSFIFTHSLTIGCRRIKSVYGRFEYLYIAKLGLQQASS